MISRAAAKVRPGSGGTGPAEPPKIKPLPYTRYYTRFPEDSCSQEVEYRTMNRGAD